MRLGEEERGGAEGGEGREEGEGLTRLFGKGESGRDGCVEPLRLRHDGLRLRGDDEVRIVRWLG